jgi:hypothetical protein
MCWIIALLPHFESLEQLENSWPALNDGQIVWPSIVWVSDVQMAIAHLGCITMTERHMNSYSSNHRAFPPPLTSADITFLFNKRPGWFDRHRVRKRLYAKGFPRPFERGLWSAPAVADWLAQAGRNPDQMCPRDTGRCKPSARNRGNAYVPVR